VDDHLRSQLTAAVGARGIDSARVVHPSSVAQLREVLQACATAGVTVAAAGHPRATGAGVTIAVDRLEAVLLDPAALLLRAGGAALWPAIRQAAAAKGFAVSRLPSVRSDTAGQSVALGEISGRSLAGVDLLTPGGRLISAGGRTLKDVVGYDLVGLALGSGDRLGTVVAVTLRVEPAGARSPAVSGPGQWRGDAGVDLAAALAG
jgi:glycolate oxidase